MVGSSAGALLGEPADALVQYLWTAVVLLPPVRAACWHCSVLSIALLPGLRCCQGEDACRYPVYWPPLKA